MKNTALIVLALIFIVITVSDSHAQGQRRGDDLPRLHEKLNLSTEQAEKITELRISHQKKMIDLKAELQKARLNKSDYKRSGEFNRADFLDRTRKMNSIKNNISEERANHLADIYEILTIEQRQIWNELKRERPGRDEDRRMHPRKNHKFRDRQF